MGEARTRDRVLKCWDTTEAAAFSVWGKWVRGREVDTQFT